MVTVSATLSSSLKSNLRDSFMVMFAIFSTVESEMETWMSSIIKVAVTVKRSSPTMMWILPSTQSNLHWLLEVDSVFKEGPLRGIDHWTEVLGPNFQPI